MDSPASTSYGNILLALIALVQSALWPLLLGWIVLPLRSELHGYIRLLLRILETRAFSLKAGGVEVSSQELLKPLDESPPIAEKQLLPSKILKFPKKDTEQE